MSSTIFLPALLTLFVLLFATQSKIEASTIDHKSCYTLLFEILDNKTPDDIEEGIKKLHFLDLPELEASGWDFLTNYYDLLTHFIKLADHDRKKIARILAYSYQTILHDERLSEKTRADTFGLILSTVIYGQKEQIYYMSYPTIISPVELMEEYLVKYGEKAVDPFWTTYVDGIRPTNKLELRLSVEMLFNYHFSLFRESLRAARSGERLEETIEKTTIGTILSTSLQKVVDHTTFANFLLHWSYETASFLKRKSLPLTTEHSPLILIETMFTAVRISTLEIDEIEKESILEALYEFCVHFYPDGAVPASVHERLIEIIYRK